MEEQKKKRKAFEEGVTRAESDSYPKKQHREQQKQQIQRQEQADKMMSHANQAMSRISQGEGRMPLEGRFWYLGFGEASFVGHESPPCMLVLRTRKCHELESHGGGTQQLGPGSATTGWEVLGTWITQFWLADGQNDPFPGHSSENGSTPSQL